MSYNCVESKKHQRGYIVHQVLSPDGRTTSWISYGQVVGGLAWPTIEAPGYFCILGEELVFPQDSRDQTRGKATLLWEEDFDRISLDGMFAKVSDAAVLLGCKSIFADLSELNTDFIQAFQDYVYSHNVSFLRLEEAPYGRIPMVGVGLIQDWLRSGRLEIPEGSLIHNQLKSMARQDLEPASQAALHAVTGFRYAVGSIHKNRPHISRRRSSRRRGAMIV